ncbi:MAG: hypothetical protein AAGU27_19325 [Dehalobacterium sp.]
MHYKRTSLIKPSMIFCFIIVFSVMIWGCGKQAEDGKEDTPRTAQEAGIETKDSDQCEKCHLSAETISSFEKPKTEETAQSEGEGG